ncbi:uncharacterized protein LOC110627364 [Manihot esculenta]|uniref:uncharacterized protein LOC110627364 n=1 Tax=Manihot esculenta TaxID=3983 RepID=UPI000B5D1147|nr:uncharacterized protein LOC110627364 [Manihot esculenta]
MATIGIPNIVGLRSTVTPSTLSNFFSVEYIDTSICRIPLYNERIVLLVPPSMGLIDPQQGHSLIFYVKQCDFGLTFPFSPFFIEVFRHFGVTPHMLSPNFILFMCSFESIGLSWGLVPSVTLFFTFFCLVQANHGFYYFAPQGGLSIFMGYKDSIKGQAKAFVVVELKEGFRIDWDVDLSWREVLQGCNDLPQLPLVDQICLLQLTSVQRKYDVKKCTFMSSLRDCQEAASTMPMDKVKLISCRCEP